MHNGIVRPGNILARIHAWLTIGADWHPHPVADGLQMRRRNGNVIEYREPTAEEEKKAAEWQAMR